MSETALPPSDVVVDCLGRPCPVPVIELARAARGAAAGTVVEVVSDDAAARVDVPAWCAMKGHEHLGERRHERGAGQVVRLRGA